MSGFNLGLFQKNFGGNHRIAGVSINLGCTKGRGSSTRMFNYCKTHSENPSECINQFIKINNTNNSILLTNWSGNTSRQFNEIYTPKSYSELTSIVSKMTPNTPIIVKSSSYSWSPFLFTKGIYTNKNINPICINTTEYKGEITINETNQTVTCLSGTYLGELLCYLGLNGGYTLDQFPNIPFATIGGAIATCTHGSSTSVGTISELVTELWYVLPGFTEEVKVSNDLLGAYASVLGQIGIITRVTLRIIPTFWLSLNKQTITVTDLINNVSNLFDTSDYLSCYWTPNTNTVDLRQYTKISDSVTLPISLFQCKIDNKFMVYQNIQNMDAYSEAPVLDWQIGNSRHTLNESGLGECDKQSSVPTGNPEYIEVEYAFDISYLQEAINVVNDWVNNYDTQMSLGVFVRFSGEDTLPWLSNCKGIAKNVWFLIDVDKKSNYNYNFNILEKNMWQYVGARPHLGKWNNVDNNTFIEMYGSDGATFLQMANS